MAALDEDTNCHDRLVSLEISLVMDCFIAKRTMARLIITARPIYSFAEDWIKWMMISNFHSVRFIDMICASFVMFSLRGKKPEETNITTSHVTCNSDISETKFLREKMKAMGCNFDPSVGAIKKKLPNKVIIVDACRIF